MMNTALYLAITYLIVLFLCFWFQREMIYFPQQEFPMPAEAAVPEMEVVELHTADNLTLKAWYKRASVGKPTLVYFHGNGGHIGMRGTQVSPYLVRGYGVLLVSYRGYSGNPGKPSEQGLYSDGRAALSFLSKEGVAMAEVALIGESIGSAVALQMATEERIAAIILLAPFTSLVELGRHHYPYLPIKMLLVERFDSLAKAQEVDSSILIIHGEEDKIVPPQLGRKLYDQLRGVKEFHLIPNRGHNNLFEPNLILSFIEKVIIERRKQDSSPN